MRKLINSSGLTKKELTVMLFLVLTFCAGLIIKLTGWTQPSEFDYSESDKRFEGKLKSEFKQLGQRQLDSAEQKRLKELKEFTDNIYNSDEKSSNKDSGNRPAGKININLALSGDLQQLPGIGLVISERIIEYREKNGKFNKIEDLMKVKGIGEKKFERIKEYLITD